MTTVVCWISREREFPTLWVAADSRFSRCSPDLLESKPLIDCGAKIFSLRVICFERNNNCRYENIYHTKTFGMAFAGSSILPMNLYAFLSHTLGNLTNDNHYIPSMEDIATHVSAAFNSILENYIDTNLESTPCELAIFGYCDKTKKLRLFHIMHEGKGRNSAFQEFEFKDEMSIFLMGGHKAEILDSIYKDRENPDLTHIGEHRSPMHTIDRLISRESYEDIGGRLQLGICYKIAFRLTPVFYANSWNWYLLNQHHPELIYQGLNLYSNPFLSTVGDCLLDRYNIPIEQT